MFDAFVPLLLAALPAALSYCLQATEPGAVLSTGSPTTPLVENELFSSFRWILRKLPFEWLPYFTPVAFAVHRFHPAKYAMAMTSMCSKCTIERLKNPKKG